MKKINSLIVTSFFILLNVFSFSQETKTMECNGFKMTSEGDKSCNYISSSDGMTRNIYATIKQDSIIMTIFRTKTDGSVDMLKKTHAYIGDLDFSKPATGVFSWMNGSTKIHKLNFIIVDSRNYFFQEMLCTTVKKVSIVNSSNALEMSFSDETQARAFYEKVKAIKSTLPETKTSSAVKSNDKLNKVLNVFNDTKKEVCLMVEGQSGQCFYNASTHNIGPCNPGDKVFYSTREGKKEGLAFVVTEQMLKDEKINLSNQSKR